MIEELIADSKKRKVERAREHEQMLDMTEKLDNDWRELIPVVNKLQKQEAEKKEQDDYDRLVKEMIFAPRGEPAQKLKNEEDVARIEKERLEKLERERLSRMKGEQDDNTPQMPNHRSADDLDDGYCLEPVVEEAETDEKVLSYAINPEGEESNEEAEDDDDETSQNGNEETAKQDESEQEEDDDESGSEEESDVDSLEDLKADESEEEPVVDPKVLKIADQNEKPEKALKENVIVQEPTLSKKQTEALEKIPYTIKMPDSYENLIELLQSQPAKIQGIIIDRIIKTNHPRLMHVNRSRMLKLFAYLLQYTNDLFATTSTETVKKQFKLLNVMLPFMFDLIQMNPEEASKCFLEVIKEKYEDFKKNQKRYPQLDTLVFFKILGSLFPTSDFRHPIITPCYVFLHHILSQAKVKSRSDIAAGLFLVTLVLDYQQLSKKFLPAVMNFLSGVCYLGVKTSMMEKLKPVPPFKKNDMLLVLDGKFKGEITKLSSEDFSDSPIDDEFKVRALNATVNLMIDFVKLYDELIGMKYFLDPFETVLNRLVEQEFLPKAFKTNLKSALDEFQRIQLDKKFVFPAPERKIQSMIRMLEPRFETVLSDRRTMYSQATGPKAEQQKLKHMIKREFKSAKRELRRDNEFLSKIRHKRRMDQDLERKAKVKRIFNEASIQQSEFNASARTKGRRGKN